jgi:hypothetical protein
VTPSQQDASTKYSSLLTGLIVIVMRMFCKAAWRYVVVGLAIGKGIKIRVACILKLQSVLAAFQHVVVTKR